MPKRQIKPFYDQAQSSTVDEENSSEDEHFWRNTTNES